MAVNTKHRPCLPDLVIDQILRSLPTKAAVRMSFLSKQWEGVWSLLPSLDFDEGSHPDHYYHHNHVVDSENLLRHKRFVNNILAKYLEYRQKDEKKDVLDKLKIRMCSLFFVSSTSLKSLELNHCTAKNVIVHEAVNLESFTFVSAHFPLDLIVLNQSDNLKYINIHAQHLQTITLFGCHESVKATIDTPNLLSLQFNGYVSYSKVCVKAPNLRGASIALWDVWDEELCTIDGPWKHFPALRDFLKEFGFLESLLLSVPDFKALIFPENFRKTFSSPLPNLRNFSILLSNPPTEATDMYDLRESFGWIAPSANVIMFKGSPGMVLVAQLHMVFEGP
ncbi:putative F-box/FBD/LRR-repeat protein At5g22610 [Prunus persica]|uniref:putative F-box/FBD/LRR-repeat protein At5g22610 n=1 Tax=Prunus persica TaxID=3760 RepID=UPI0009AB944F|nr:putative F-box/FBD/LRR-repeat protein At5g22610 [Prunus persica]